jgi:hypothetical protein
VLAVAPGTAAAATFREIVDGSLVPLGNRVLYVIYALAFLFFMFGVFKYFFASGKSADGERSKGKLFMLWGLIGLVVLVAVWGFVNILLNTLRSWT